MEYKVLQEVRLSRYAYFGVWRNQFTSLLPLPVPLKAEKDAPGGGINTAQEYLCCIGSAVMTRSSDDRGSPLRVH